MRRQGCTGNQRMCLPIEVVQLPRELGLPDSSQRSSSEQSFLISELVPVAAIFALGIFLMIISLPRTDLPQIVKHLPSSPFRTTHSGAQVGAAPLFLRCVKPDLGMTCGLLKPPQRVSRAQGNLSLRCMEQVHPCLFRSVQGINSKELRLLLFILVFI